jgi:hypothetical protein
MRRHGTIGNQPSITIHIPENGKPTLRPEGEEDSVDLLIVHLFGPLQLQRSLTHQNLGPVLSNPMGQRPDHRHNDQRLEHRCPDENEKKGARKGPVERAKGSPLHDDASANLYPAPQTV